MKQLILKPGRQKNTLERHHWIFSGGVAQMPNNIKEGELCEIRSSDHQLLGHGFVSTKGSISVRMINYSSEDPIESIEHSLKRAYHLRQDLALETTGYRLCNAEGDLLPGLIIDVYHPYIVIQIGTRGFELYKQKLIDILLSLIPDCKGIYEKSLSPSRLEEGLAPVEGVLFGTIPEYHQIIEGSIRCEISIPHGQKTGFFLDQREMRLLVGRISRNKRVLNCFSYSGGFSLHALRGGAIHVTNVDISAKALELAQRNATYNGFSQDQLSFVCSDVFTFLKEHPLRYDCIILDPPAFAKKKKDIRAASTAYRNLNALAIKRAEKGTLLLTCSCSHFIDEERFQTIIYKASLEAGRSVKILSSHIQASDHPVNMFHRETSYLKSLLLYIE